LIQTVSSQLIEPIPYINPKLKILLTVLIRKDNEYSFSRYATEKGDFIKVEPHAHISMRYITKDTEWSRDKQVSINQRNIYSLRLGLRKFYKNFQRENIYRYDHGKITELLVEERDTVFIPLGKDQCIRLRPTIVRDRLNTIYPGVELTINRDDNIVELTVDEFESVMDLFQTINIYQSGLTLMNTALLTMRFKIPDKNPDKTSKKETEKPKYQKSMFQDRIGTNEKVSGPPVVQQPKTLDEL
jgi:hypothetical protein